MKRILVPVDFSSTSRKAVKIAEGWAKKFGASIELFYVEEAYTSSHGVDGEYLYESMEDAFLLQLLDEHKQNIRELADTLDRTIEVKTDVRIGRVISSVEEKIKDGEHDLIVMGTRGMNEWDRLLIGSNAEKMVRRSKVPLLVVPKTTNDTAKINKIVLATNASERYEGFIQQVKSLQQVFSAELSLVRVVTVNDFYPTYEATALLHEFAEKYQLTNYSTHVYNAHNVEEGIVGFADEQQAGLIAMASHRRTIFGSLFGSVSQDVIEESSIPVFTVNID